MCVCVCVLAKADLNNTFGATEKLSPSRRNGFILNHANDEHWNDNRTHAHKHTLRFFGRVGVWWSWSWNVGQAFNLSLSPSLALSVAGHAFNSVSEPEWSISASSVCRVLVICNARWPLIRPVCKLRNPHPTVPTQHKKVRVRVKTRGVHCVKWSANI